MSRSQRILAYIAASKVSVTQSEVVAAVTDPDKHEPKLPQIVSAQLSQLTAAGKLHRTGKPFERRYSATATALVDRRKLGAGKRDATPPKPKPTARKASGRRQVAGLPRLQVTPPATPRPRLNEPTLTARPTPRAGGALTSAQIAADLAEFERRGGKVQVLHDGDVSQHFRYLDVHALNEGSWRERAASERNHHHQDDGDEADAP